MGAARFNPFCRFYGCQFMLYSALADAFHRTYLTFASQSIVYSCPPVHSAGGNPGSAGGQLGSDITELSRYYSSHMHRVKHDIVGTGGCRTCLAVLYASECAAITFACDAACSCHWWHSWNAA